jgi:hypothetical protein
MTKPATSNPPNTTFRPPQDIAKAAAKEARRLGRKPAVVLKYWLRLGLQSEPEIKAVLP